MGEDDESRNLGAQHRLNLFSQVMALLDRPLTWHKQMKGRERASARLASAQRMK